MQLELGEHSEALDHATVPISDNVFPDVIFKGANVTSQH
jgi:hypothetical protein